MRCLLDTHALLWFLTDDSRLSDKARSTIESLDNSVLVSLASLWEIAIKAALGKLELIRPFEDLFPDQLDANDIELLPIAIRHLSRVGRLPLTHRDPFDRLLVAQALTDHLRLVTRDHVFADYGLDPIW